MASFNSTLDLNKVKVSTQTIAALSLDDSKLNSAMEKLEKYGFIIISNSPGKTVTNDEIRENVLDLKPLFGTAAYHIRADDDGVCPIGNFIAVDIATKEKQTKKMKGVCKATTSDEHEPHTDSTFQKRSDEFLSLTCYQPSLDGGESYVVSGAAIYEHIKKVLKPSQIRPLFRSDAVTFTRGEESATKAIFTKDEKTGSIVLVWRKDIIVNKMDEAVHPDAVAGVLAMVSFIEDERNHAVYKLQRNETLLCNNGAVLHARKSFPDDQIRRLDRLNFFTIGSGAKLDGRLQLGFKEQHTATATGNGMLGKKTGDYKKAFPFPAATPRNSIVLSTDIDGGSCRRLSIISQAA
jgi:alpha-ketoglutarate-dependent taurine dioxygenase